MARSSRPSTVALSITLVITRGSGEKCSAFSDASSIHGALSRVTGRVVTSAKRTESANSHDFLALPIASSRYQADRCSAGR